MPENVTTRLGGPDVKMDKVEMDKIGTLGEGGLVTKKKVFCSFVFFFYGYALKL